MNLVYGIPASNGIAIGNILFYDQVSNFDLSKFKLLPIENSIQIFKEAILNTISYLEELTKKTEKEIGFKEAAIFDAQILMLEDNDFQESIIQKLRENISLDQAILNVTNDYVEKFNHMKNQYFKERSSDIKDVGKQILKTLSGKRPSLLSNLKNEVIIIAKELTPSDTAEMDKDKILGFATELGGSTSHVAIIARALNVPAVVGAKELIKTAKENNFAIIDGNNGKIIINPDEKTLNKFKAIQTTFYEEEHENKRFSTRKAKTKDGYEFKVFANIGSVEEVNQALENGADGIGLFRTEFLYLKNEKLPEEDIQYSTYKKVLKAMKGRPVVLRTLDVGGDKNIPFLNLRKENNPFLGLRGSRFLLNENLKDVLRSQIRAALRASFDGHLKIMFPMVSIFEEIDELSTMVKQCKKELEEEGYEIAKSVEIGIMVEVPAAAICAENIAPYIDFFSIGTNDLTQYLLAADRTNEQMAAIYDHYHPSIFFLIQKVVEVAKKYGKWVGICGELASETLATPILLGLGIDELSMNPSSIPRVKRKISSLSLDECKNIVKTVLNLSGAPEVRKFLSIDPTTKI